MSRRPPDPKPPPPTERSLSRLEPPVRHLTKAGHPRVSARRGGQLSHRSLALRPPAFCSKALVVTGALAVAMVASVPGCEIPCETIRTCPVEAMGGDHSLAGSASSDGKLDGNGRNTSGGAPGLGGAANGRSAEGGVGGSSPTSGGAPGDGGSSGQAGCPDGWADCNAVVADACEIDITTFSTPDDVSPLRPLRSAYTGSLHAPAAAATLRPEFRWTASVSHCGALHYEFELDDSCGPGQLTNCAFSSPELTATTSEPVFQPKEDLAVARTAPVGTFYAWRVRACDASGGCSPWSDVAGVNVGRAEQDLNGDGYADTGMDAAAGIDFYLGGPSFNGQADQRLALSYDYRNRTRFVGDLNGDGFADLATLISDSVLCGQSGYVAEVIFGASDLTNAKGQVLCRTAGSASVNLVPRDLGDLNGDGFDDLGVTWGFNDAENSLLVFAGAAVIGEEPLVEPEAAHRYYLLSSSAQIVAGRGDYNGDGYMDVVAGGYATTDPNEFYVLLGDKTLSVDFDVTLTSSECFTLYWLTVTADADGDGDQEWAAVCENSERTGALFGLLKGGTPSGELTLDSTWATDIPLRSTTPWLDFDGDGTGEFILGADTPVIWRPGLTDPNDPDRYTRLGASPTIDVADHNGDGRLDLVVGDGAKAARIGASTSFNVVPTYLVTASDVADSEALVF